jgi:hypothetical protein
MPPIRNKMPAAVVAGVVASCILVPSISAQTPTVAIYFDEHFSFPRVELCQGDGVMDTLWVVAEGFNDWITAIEYAINYSDMTGIMIWLADLPVTVLNIGSTPGGVATSWLTPQNGFQPLLVMQVLIMWTCDDCSSARYLSVGWHPRTGHLRAVRYPDRAFIEATALASYVCPAGLATETATWGSVKALYGD